MLDWSTGRMEVGKTFLCVARRLAKQLHFSSLQRSVRVKDKQAKGHVKCTMLSGNFIRSQTQRATRNAQRATCNVNGSCQVFLFVFHRPGRAAAIYLPRSVPAALGAPLALATLLTFLPPGRRNQLPLRPAPEPFARLAVYVFLFYIITLTLRRLQFQLGLAWPGLAINSSSLGPCGQRVLHKL